MKINARVILLPMLLFMASVFAKPQMGDTPDMFKVFDTNGDGKVTEQEYLDSMKARLMQTFQRMDLNGDGVVTREENDEVLNKMREMYQRGMPSR